MSDVTGLALSERSLHKTRGIPVKNKIKKFGLPNLKLMGPSAQS
jgi:hypothetical protein